MILMNSERKIIQVVDFICSKAGDIMCEALLKRKQSTDVFLNFLGVKKQLLQEQSCALTRRIGLGANRSVIGLEVSNVLVCHRKVQVVVSNKGIREYVLYLATLLQRWERSVSLNMKQQLLQNLFVMILIKAHIAPT